MLSWMYLGIIYRLRMHRLFPIEVHANEVQFSSHSDYRVNLVEGVRSSHISLHFYSLVSVSPPKAPFILFCSCNSPLPSLSLFSSLFSLSVDDG